MSQVKSVKSISIVICTYNRADDLCKTLTALMNVLITGVDIEVIVVDDCSPDNTKEIVSQFDVTYIRNAQNSGIPVSRNAGLNAAGGQVIVYLDDDCIPSKQWLPELLKYYEDESVMAVGGLVGAQNMHNIISLYMLGVGYGNAIMQKKKKAFKNPFISALLNYITINLFQIADSKEEVHEVHEIYGANCSFVRQRLLDIGGYDENFKVAEDAEICHRLGKTYPDKKILFSKSASVAHKHYTSLALYIKVTFKRASKNFDFTAKKNKTVPKIYPLPFLYVLSLVLAFFISKPLFALSLVFLPQLFYFWWPRQLFTKLKPYFFLFPYLQCLLEVTEMLGVAFAKIKSLFKK